MESPLTLFYSPQLTSLIFSTLTDRAVAPLSAVALLSGMALWPAYKVPSGLPPSSCQRSLGVQSLEQKGLVCSYNSANQPYSGESRSFH